MATVLLIDTSGTRGYVALANEGQIVAQKVNENPFDHAAFLQPAVQEISTETGVALKEIDAVAVSNGPGSYTGLRVSLASAKGLCFALQKPLITCSTLEVMALAAKITTPSTSYYCPMIDARRMEVFYALYDNSMHCLQEPNNLIVDEHSFSQELLHHSICFSGDGSLKFEKLCNHHNAVFQGISNCEIAFANKAHTAFMKNEFADLAYAEPFYVKAFHSTVKSK